MVLKCTFFKRSIKDSLCMLKKQKKFIQMLHMSSRLYIQTHFTIKMHNIAQQETCYKMCYQAISCLIHVAATAIGGQTFRRTELAVLCEWEGWCYSLLWQGDSDQLCVSLCSGIYELFSCSVMEHEQGLEKVQWLHMSWRKHKVTFTIQSWSLLCDGEELASGGVGKWPVGGNLQ